MTAKNLLENDAQITASFERVSLNWISASLNGSLVKKRDGRPSSRMKLRIYIDVFSLSTSCTGTRKICPTGPIDEFWHAHILDTEAYARDCNELFGEYLHHFPYFGMRGPADRADLETAFEQSRVLFIRHFGIDPCGGEAQARGCSPQRCP